jgi:hypothetical protein
MVGHVQRAPTHSDKTIQKRLSVNDHGNIIDWQGCLLTYPDGSTAVR